MHSKWKIWDFFKARPNILDEKVSIVAISGFDPLVFQYIKNQINKDKFFTDGKLSVHLGNEISRQWFEDNFQSLGLFGNQDSFLIHYSEHLNAQVKQNILESDNLLLDNRFLILNFHKEDDFFKKLQKSKSNYIETIKIQAPAFWEESELLDFLCTQEKVYLTFRAKEKLREMLPFHIASYYQVISQIKINFDGKTNVDVEDILPLFSEAKVDHFDLANDFGTKKMHAFYKKITKQYLMGAEVIGSLYFLQSHLIKMYDLSYLDNKDRITKYDKQVIAHAKLWNKDEVIRGLNYLGDLIIKCKSRDTSFEQKLKLGVVKTMGF